MTATSDYVAPLDQAAVLAESTQTDGTWTHKCGTDLLGARVHHSVWEFPQACAGSGEVQVQTVAYCPLCHEKPSPYGAPLRPRDTEWPKVLVKVKNNDGPADG